MSILTHFSDKDIGNLQSYKHSCDDKSILSKRVLTPFWIRVSSVLPSSITPNMITLFGGAFMMAVFIFTLFTADNFLTTHVSAFHSLLAGFAFFVFNTTDGVDGIHARRTKQSSPLGDLLDHAVDSLVYLFGSILIVAVLVPVNPILCFCTIASALISALAMEVEYLVTKSLRFGVVSAPVEGVLGAAFLGFIGFLNIDFYAGTLSCFGFKLSYGTLTLILMMALFVFSSLNSFISCLIYSLETG
ncbi:hypothetical protein GEMRC1_001751 [Eukaryota sp. GEM-RC1]